MPRLDARPGRCVGISCMLPWSVFSVHPDHAHAELHPAPPDFMALDKLIYGALVLQRGCRNHHCRRSREAPRSRAVESSCSMSRAAHSRRTAGRPHMVHSREVHGDTRNKGPEDGPMKRATRVRKHSRALTTT